MRAITRSGTGRVVAEAAIDWRRRAEERVRVSDRRAIAVFPVSDAEFIMRGRYHTRLGFTLGPDGQATGATLNPGPWAQAGARAPDE